MGTILQQRGGPRGRRRMWLSIPMAVTGAVLGAGALLFGLTPDASGNADVAPRFTPGQLAACPWLDQGIPAGRRASMLMAAMTPLQEASLLHLYWGGSPANPYEGLSPAIPSLCVPAITEQDGAAGVGSGWRTAAGQFQGVTQLPAPIAAAATFDATRAGAYGKVIGAEDAAVGVDMALAPTINIERDPRWGRAYESLGEDPFLTASLAVPLIDGIQSQGVVSVAKHYAVYNQETGRGTLHDDSVVSDRALHEIYLPAWSAAVRLAKPGGVMCAYDLVNGVPSCQSEMLLRSQLRGAWGFDGFVRSDCGSIFDQGASMAAGVSQVKCTRLYQPRSIASAVASGALPKSELDSLVRPLLEVLFAYNLIADHHELHPNADVSSGADQAVALRVANEGAVLLKNDGILPLDPAHLRSMALIGPHGGSPMTAGYGAMRVHSEAVVTARQALQSALGSRFVYTNGADISEAARVARAASVAVVVVHDVESEGVDRSTLKLPGSQDALVSAVAAANPRTVVVLETGSPAYMPWLRSVGAALETWYPGQAAGTSLVQLLTGEVDPSGKLPVSWPAPDAPGLDASVQQFGGGGGPTHFDEGVNVGYRWYQANDVKPQFPFGFGLSYTSFRFSGLHITPAANGGFTVTATVLNAGPRAGAEVAECYVRYPAGLGEPPLQLRGLARVELGAGGRGVVRFPITAGDLATWSGAPGTVGTWSVAGGTYQIYVGDASDAAHLPLHGSVVAAPAGLGPAGGPGPVAG